MGTIFNVYCDESCHLENDRQPVMVLGAIWSKKDIVKTINERIRRMKTEYGLNERMEIKWTKVSPAQAAFYLKIIDYFFSERDLHYRGLIVIQKANLDHRAYSQTHDSWYYKMYFNLLKIIIEPENRYHIYLDIKDTRSAEKIRKLHEVLANNIYDFSREIVEKIQIVRSHEVEILQLADLINGALSHFHRRLNTSPTKQAIIEEIKRRSNYSLNLTTLAREPKFNILIWTPQTPEAEQ